MGDRDVLVPVDLGFEASPARILCSLPKDPVGSPASPGCIPALGAAPSGCSGTSLAQFPLLFPRQPGCAHTLEAVLTPGCVLTPRQVPGANEAAEPHEMVLSNERLQLQELL